MGSIVKVNTYRLVDNHSFELPMPFKFEILKKDCPVADYEVSDGEAVSCTILTKFKEDMLTTLHRPLNIADIYYLLSCRVFQDRTPYTYHMLQSVGLEKYNVLDILHKTHGIIPYDNYWLKFEGEDELTYEQVSNQFNMMMEAPIAPATEAAPAAVQNNSLNPSLDEILSQHTIDISGLVATEGVPVPSTPEEAENMLRRAVAFSIPEEKDEDLVNNKMSESEIEALLMKAGIATEEPSHKEESGGQMSQSDIEAMFAVSSVTTEPASESGGGMMSEEAIAALLAANAAPAEPEPAPVEEAPASGGMMSEEAIAALLAANSASEAESTNEASSITASSGGMMSEEAIAALLAANNAPEQESAPAEEPSAEEITDNGGKMSQDDIAALFAANAAPAEPEPAPVEEAPASGGKMSQDDIAALFAANAAPAEPEPAPVEEAPASGGKMSQADIEALLNSMAEEASK